MSVEEGEDVARDLIRFVFSFMLDDLTWQLVGFRRRPRRDAWLDRFISEKKLKLENALKREFCCLGLATSARWIHSRSSDIESPRFLLARILEISIYGNLDGSPPYTQSYMWPHFQFNDGNEAIDFFFRGIEEYIDTKYSEVFHKRMIPNLDDSEHGAWLVHSVSLCGGPQSPLLHANVAMDSAHPGRSLAPLLRSEGHNSEYLFTEFSETILTAMSNG